MSKQFKDFNKDVNDLITKGILKPQDWKIETKGKASNGLGGIAINPTINAGSKQSVTVALDWKMSEWKSEGKVKFNKGAAIASEFTYTGLIGHKIKLTVDDVCHPEDLNNFKIDDEIKMGDVAANVNFGMKTGVVDASVSYLVVPQAVVGANVKLATKDGAGLKSWSVGARAQAFNECYVNASTENGKKFSTGVICPVKIVENKTTTIAAHVETGDKFVAKVGIQQPCIFCPCNTWKVVANNEGNVTIAAIMKFADKWKASVSMSIKECCKFGFELVRE